MLQFCGDQIHPDGPGTKELPPVMALVHDLTLIKGHRVIRVFRERTLPRKTQQDSKRIKLTISTIVNGQWQKWFHGCRNGGSKYKMHRYRIPTVIIKLQRMFKSFFSLKYVMFGIQNNICNRLVTQTFLTSLLKTYMCRRSQTSVKEIQVPFRSSNHLQIICSFTGILHTTDNELQAESPINKIFRI